MRPNNHKKTKMMVRATAGFRQRSQIRRIFFKEKIPRPADEGRTGLLDETHPVQTIHNPAQVLVSCLDYLGSRLHGWGKIWVGTSVNPELYRFHLIRRRKVTTISFVPQFSCLSDTFTRRGSVVTNRATYRIVVVMAIKFIGDLWYTATVTIL